MSVNDYSTIENAADIRVSGGLQTNFSTPSNELRYLSVSSANPGPGTVQFQTATAIGQKGVSDVVKTLTNVEKSLTFLNKPNQLKLLSQWTFGEHIFESAPSVLIYISSQDMDTTRVNSTKDSFKIEKSLDEGTTWTEILLSVSLPANVSEIITAINTLPTYHAEVIYGDASENYSFEGILNLTLADLIPATPYGSSDAVLSIFKPMNGAPKQMSFLYELFSGSNNVMYREDIGAMLTSMSIEMPKDGLSTLAMQYFAKENIAVKQVNVPVPITKSDMGAQYKGSEGLYNLILGNKKYPTIDSVAWSFTNNTTVLKGWAGNQIATAPKNYASQMQVNAWLEQGLYNDIVSLYEARVEQESFIPALMYVLNQQYADAELKIPYMFGTIYPKAKISAAPELTVEAASDIPCNFTLTPTELGTGVSGESLLFFTITEV